MKMALKGRRFQDEDEIKHNAMELLQEISKSGRAVEDIVRTQEFILKEIQCK